jgi:hypothetical protein
MPGSLHPVRFSDRNIVRIPDLFSTCYMPAHFIANMIC